MDSRAAPKGATTELQAGAPPAPASFPMNSTISPVREIEMTTLANGVRVITEAMPHVRSVSVGIWIGTGSRRETQEQNGLSHFIEHMLFKGTTRRSAEDIARSVDSMAATSTRSPRRNWFASTPRFWMSICLSPGMFWPTWF